MGAALRKGGATALLAVVLLATVVVSGAAGAEKVFVQRAPGAEQMLYYRPHVFYISADGTFYLTGVKWHAYDGATATATAFAHTNNCIPLCLGGTYTTHRAKLRLTGRTFCRARDRTVYTSLFFHILGNVPKNFGNGRGSISMRPVDVDGERLC